MFLVPAHPIVSLVRLRPSVEVKRIYLGENSGIEGPVGEGSEFAVLDPKGPSSMAIFGEDGKLRTRANVPIGFQSVGVSGGSVSFVDDRPVRSIPDAGQARDYAGPVRLVRVLGDWSLWRTASPDRYVAINMKEWVPFSAPYGRGSCAALWGSPAVAYVYSVYQARTMFAVILPSGKRQRFSLRVPLCSRYQTPQFIGVGPSKIAYYADVENVPAAQASSVPVLREREAAGREVYYRRALIECDLIRGTFTILAVVEVASLDPRGLSSIDLTPKLVGNDLVRLKDSLVVRGNTVAWVLPMAK